MNNLTAKPQVTPPESHKEPSFPTLAALGVLAASALAGCDKGGGMRGEMRTLGVLAPIENGCETAPPLGGEAEYIPIQGEMPAVQIPPEEKEMEMNVRGRIPPVSLPAEEKETKLILRGEPSSVVLPEKILDNPPKILGIMMLPHK